MTGSPEEYPYLEDLITRYTSRLPRFLDREAVGQAGREGFVNAARRFDKSRGAKFSTYAYRRVLGEMQDEVRRLNHHRGRRPPGVEIHPVATVSANATNETIDPAETICDRLTLEAAIRNLPPRPRFIVLGLRNDIPQHELAHHLGITEGGVTHMKNRAFELIRSEMAA